MWRPDQNWFHDYDTQAGHFTEVLDTMQLAPLLCEVASSEQRAALQPKIFDPPKHGQIFHPLMWPSIAFCLIEAAAASNYHQAAARHSWNALAPVYRWLDSNPASIDTESGGLPGIGREYWPQVVNPTASTPQGGGGAEVYGWGCLGALLLYRHIIGLHETFELAASGINPAPTNTETLEETIAPSPSFSFSLTPGLPDSLLQSGQRYGVGPLHFREARFNLSYRVLDNTDKLEMRLVLTTSTARRLEIKNNSGLVLYQTEKASRLHRLRIIVTNYETIQLNFYPTSA
jgi:hypothetical protein